MQTLNWLESHVGSIDDGLKLINRLYWTLTIEEVKTLNGGTPYWYVKGGEKVIFSADSIDAVNAFLYGMSLAYASMPESFFDELVRFTEI